MKFRIYLTMAILAMSGLIVAGCAPAATPEPEVAAPEVEEVPPEPNIAIYAHTSTFPDLDPSPGLSNENVVTVNVYETLTFYNPPGSVETVSPKLATSWEASEDALTWTFNLLEGVKFHDGTDFNAEAVKFSIERTMEIGLGAAYIYAPVEEIEVVDDLTVRFHLSFALPMDLVLSSGYGAWIMSPTAVADKDSDWFNEGNDAGTGPYTIQSYEVGQRLVISRFDDYWGGWEEGQFDTVVFDIIEDPTVAEQMIRSGEADFTYNLPFENYAALSEVEGVTVDITPSFQNLLALLNHRKPPTDDPLVRQALAYSFPYDKVVENLYAGLGTQARGTIPAGMWGHDPGLTQYTYDLDKAAELLAEAGFPDGGFEVTYTYVAGDLDEQQVGELWRAELAKLGVDLEVQGLQWEAQWDLAINNPEGAQDAFSFYWWPDYVTPYGFLFGMFHSEEEPFFNLGYYSNAEFDELIDMGNEVSGVDIDKATEMFIEAQEMLVEDAAAVFILDLPDVHVIRSDIQGYVNNPAYPHVVFWYDLSR